MWQQLTLTLRSADAAALEDWLLTQGAAAVTFLDAEDQPLFQEAPGDTPLWEVSTLQALFPGEADLNGLRFLLSQHPKVLNPGSIELQELEDEHWERRWMQDFKPMRFGQRLWICPSWQEPPQAETVNIMLDPGLAFGSGTHPTTALCLEWLDQADIAGRDVIDYGCGSGILAIAAAKLDAARVVAVDHDEQAIVATRDNAERNQLPQTRIETCLPEQLQAFPADLLLANILAAPLLQLAPIFAGLVKPSGWIVLSGLLQEQCAEVSERYQADFSLSEPRIRDDWVLLAGQRRA